TLGASSRRAINTSRSLHHAVTEIDQGDGHGFLARRQEEPDRKQLAAALPRPACSGGRRSSRTGGRRNMQTMSHGAREGRRTRLAPATPLVVVASGDASLLARWRQAIGDAFPTCEACDRPSLECALADRRPPLLVLDRLLPGLGGIGGMAGI